MFVLDPAASIGYIIAGLAVGLLLLMFFRRTKDRIDSRRQIASDKSDLLRQYRHDEFAGILREYSHGDYSEVIRNTLNRVRGISEQSLRAQNKSIVEFMVPLLMGDKQEREWLLALVGQYMHTNKKIGLMPYEKNEEIPNMEIQSQPVFRQPSTPAGPRVLGERQMGHHYIDDREPPFEVSRRHTQVQRAATSNGSEGQYTQDMVDNVAAKVAAAAGSDPHRAGEAVTDAIRGRR